MRPGADERPEASPNPLAAAQQHHERYIAAIAVTACVLGDIVLVWRVLTIESVQGMRMMVFATSLGAYYLYAFFDRRVVEWKRWLRTTLEVSAATLVIILDAYAGPAFLFTTSATYIYMLTVVVSSFRLDTRISIYAASMAILEQLAVYLYVLLYKGSHLTAVAPSFSTTRVFQELLFRSGLLAILGAFGVLLTRTLRREIQKAAEEERVRSAFGSYVGRRVVDRILRGDLKIAPERRPITVMFVDIRNFTRLAESSDPAKLFEMLNDALDAFATAVQRQGGLVNKFLGDGLMAIFGAPETQADHTRRAARAALLILDEAHARRDDGR
ncbi:MAG: adenylate/guanylate cyclase domain-containing protein, partial [Polyangiaceae bacterium]